MGWPRISGNVGMALRLTYKMSQYTIRALTIMHHLYERELGSVDIHN